MPEFYCTPSQLLLTLNFIAHSLKRVVLCSLWIWKLPILQKGLQILEGIFINLISQRLCDLLILPHHLIRWLHTLGWNVDSLLLVRVRSDLIFMQLRISLPDDDVCQSSFCTSFFKLPFANVNLLLVFGLSNLSKTRKSYKFSILANRYRDICKYTVCKNYLFRIKIAANNANAINATPPKDPAMCNDFESDLLPPDFGLPLRGGRRDSSAVPVVCGFGSFEDMSSSVFSFPV